MNPETIIDFVDDLNDSVQAFIEAYIKPRKEKRNNE